MVILWFAMALWNNQMVSLFFDWSHHSSHVTYRSGWRVISPFISHDKSSLLVVESPCFIQGSARQNLPNSVNSPFQTWLCEIMWTISVQKIIMTGEIHRFYHGNLTISYVSWDIRRSSDLRRPVTWRSKSLATNMATPWPWTAAIAPLRGGKPRQPPLDPGWIHWLILLLLLIEMSTIESLLMMVNNG